MDLGLKDKLVLITGGSKGIGLACAQAFAEEGARLALTSRSAANLEAASALLKRAGATPWTRAADMGDAAAVETLIDALENESGPIDVLVTSAGAARRMPPAELTAQAFQDAMQAKYFSYVFPMNAVVKRMAARQRGVIVNVIGAGGKVASPIHLPGGAANAALMLVTAGMANAYAAQGVRVVAVNPGLTMTERLKEGMAADAKLQGIAIEEALARATSRLPLGRIAEPAEIANAVLFLASQKASYVTGAILAMDGAVTPTVC